MESLGNFPDPFIEEISGQPDALRRAAGALADQLGALADQLGVLGSRTGSARIPVLTGMGSSYHACYPTVAELAQAGIAAVHVDSAELLHFRTGMLGPRTQLVIVSQSGESAEVVALARTVRALPDPRTILAVTNGSENELATLADIVLDTRAGPETGPSTMTFGAALVTVAAAGAVLAGSPPAVTASRLALEAELAATTLEGLLADGGLGQRLVDWLGGREKVVVLGRGPARAAAEMGALTLKEAVGLPAESLETAQFRHGPLELAGPDLAAIVIATEPETLEIDVRLAADLIEAGAAVLLITEDQGGPEGAAHVGIGRLDRALAPAVSILPVQLLSWRLAGLAGRAPGAYVRGTKVTTVE